MSEPDLFGTKEGGSGGDPTPPSVGARVPLAARMRPRSIDEVKGQEHLLAPGQPLRRMLEGGTLSSCILWGPPGSGKTTLARLLAERADCAFVAFSAVTEGVARVREVIAEARTRQQATGRGTILFCDEIHRFNKSQQDAFLPHVEDGTIVLVGATTENPSFEVNRPLLSRAPVFILRPLDEEALSLVVSDALADVERGLGGAGVAADPAAIRALARGADGDARRALGALEVAVTLARDDEESSGLIDLDLVGRALQHRFALYDKTGEEHFNLISALHKAVRGSDPQGAIYWLARMIRGGEDPLYLARRLVRMAIEDIGLADPRALEVTVSAWQAYHFLGSPEGDLALAEATVYLASAPKSNRVYSAWKEALSAAEDTGSEAAPMHIRNAPTPEMRDWGYGSGYKYDPNEPSGIAGQSYLPDVLLGHRFYRPGKAGYEAELAERLETWERLRIAESEGSDDPDERRGRAPDTGPAGTHSGHEPRGPG